MGDFRRWVIGIADIFQVMLMVLAALSGGFFGATMGRYLHFAANPNSQDGAGGAAFVGFMVGAGAAFMVAAIGAAFLFTLSEIAANTRRTVLLLEAMAGKPSTAFPGAGDATASRFDYSSASNAAIARDKIDGMKKWFEATYQIRVDDRAAARLVAARASGSIQAEIDRILAAQKNGGA